MAVGGLQRGQTVLVSAASSGVGLAALQIANRLGARPIAQARPCLSDYGEQVQLRYRPVSNGWRTSVLFASSSVLLIFDFLMVITVAVFNLGQAVLADVAQFHIEVPEQSG